MHAIGNTSSKAAVSDIQNRAIDSTIGREIERLAELQPDHPAVVAPDYTPLSYRELQLLIRKTRAALRLAGFDRNTRVAIALPNSKQAALAITALGCSAIGIPLDPRLTSREVQSSLNAVRPDAVLVVQGRDCEVRRVATQNNIPVLEAVPPSDGVFSFAMVDGSFRPSAAFDQNDDPEPDAPAFILPTSGTTGEPKLVPFSHRNMLAVADRCRIWFDLTPQDRCLCVAPVFYAHGVKVAILTPLLTGGTVAFPADVSKFDYTDWFGTLKPTWYSASPATHRLVLDQIQAGADAKIEHSLRFVLSSSAPLPRSILVGLQSKLGVPLIEHYSSSEASLMAANLPSPAASKPGSLGAPWPASLIIVGDDGRQLSPNEQGEILVRGPTVISGYLDAADLNNRAFYDGWFRTGDIGSLDEDGCLTFHGRKSDVINRGGEKISPIEIDNALLRHPDIAEAVAFPTAHPRLGEDVAAAVVLKPGALITQQDLRYFLLETLAPFKLPRRIHFMERLPKGLTGKIRRREISQIVGVRSEKVDTPQWASPLEVEIASIWQDLLECKNIGPEDDFFELGGDSLLAAQMLMQLEDVVGRSLPIEVLFDAANIRHIAEALSQGKNASAQNLLVRLHPEGTKIPFIYVPGDFEKGGYYASRLARLLGRDRPFYFLQSHGFLGDYIPSIKQMAREYKQALDLAGVSGPYRLGGHCNGGLIALELASQLAAEGRKVELVALVEAISLNARPAMRLIARITKPILTLIVRDPQMRDKRFESVMSWTWYSVRNVFLQREKGISLVRALASGAARKVKRRFSDAVDYPLQRRESLPAQELLIKLFEIYHQRMASYIPVPVATRMLCIVSESNKQSLDYDGGAWRRFSSQNEVVIVPGDHSTCVTSQFFADRLRERLEALDAK